MADVDEDVLPVPSSLQQDDDPSEETQDYRFLASLSSSVILDSNQKLPKRGEKDFEANATRLQASTLESSRQAMHDALSQTRFHNPKTHVVAIYDPETGGAWVEKAKGILFNTVGQWRRDKPSCLQPDNDDTMEEKRAGGLWLHPEEALYLLERGSLDVHWPTTASSSNTTGAPDLPMSLQGAYAVFIGLAGPNQLTLEQYIVYGGLKRGGFTVIRADTESSDLLQENVHEQSSGQVTAGSWSVFVAFWQQLLTRGPRHPDNRLRTGPLVTPGLYRSYSKKRDIAL